ncbi:MAG: SsrA-binding protein SmpB [Lentisphaeria bacterium]|nr:SsrA-binding protein SmpB [Lentisphaeria bacterium]
MASKKQKNQDNTLANNRKARHNYTILETLEAGIELTGTEVKSCRAREIAMADAYVKIERGQAWLLNTHIAVYGRGNRYNHEPAQKRRLLLHKKEILKLSQQINEKGCTVVPLSFYLKGGLIKVSIALCKGKTYEDKRDTLRERADNMEARRAMAAYK